MKQPNRSVRTEVLGYVLIFVGFALFLSGVVVFVGIASAVISGLGRALGDPPTVTLNAALALAAIAAGGFILRRGATLRNNALKMRVIDGWTLLRDDPRPPILYLRSFLDDEKRSRSAPLSTGGRGVVAGVMGRVVGQLLGGAAGAHETQEEQLVKELSKLGQCIAVGDPAETLPDLGAARIYLGNDWQTHVADLMARSRLIVFRVGSHSPGFWWEVDCVRNVVPPERVAFWIPPEAEGGGTLVKSMKSSRPSSRSTYP